jgi:hypothetical protein
MDDSLTALFSRVFGPHVVGSSSNPRWCNPTSSLRSFKIGAPELPASVSHTCVKSDITVALRQSPTLGLRTAQFQESCFTAPAG